MKHFINLLVATATVVSALPIDVEKRDILAQGASTCGGQINEVQQPCGQQLQNQAVQQCGQPLQVQAVQPCAAPPVQVQAVQPCSQPLQVQAVQPCSQPLQVQAVQPCPQPLQVQAVQPCPQPLQVQAVQPCSQPLQVQAVQPPPMLQTQIYYQPPPPPPPPQMVPYYPAPQYIPEDDGCGCYSSMGNSFAGAAGRFVRNIACPWSFFVDQAENCSGDAPPPSYGSPPSYYPPPQQPPQQPPQPVYIPQAQPQQPGQWFTTVVPVVPSQGTQNQALQPVHASLVPDYGLPNGYGAVTC